jgi:hypothetical protein
MKHAGPDALDVLEPLLAQLRGRAALKERTQGVFYRAGRAFLHFHEQDAVFYADLRTGEDFERFPVTTAAERRALLQHIDLLLGGGKSRRLR